MARPTKRQSLWGTIGVLVLLAAVYAFEHWQGAKRGRNPVDAPATSGGERADNRAILRMHQRKAREEWVEGASIVVKVLRDDLEGSRHQRFLIRIGEDVRVKVAHNIDLAPRLPVRVGDLVAYRGKYVWNDLGGALHWTHHDPRKRTKGGWLRHAGKVYK